MSSASVVAATIEPSDLSGFTEDPSAYKCANKTTDVGTSLQCNYDPSRLTTVPSANSTTEEEASTGMTWERRRMIIALSFIFIGIMIALLIVIYCWRKKDRTNRVGRSSSA